MKVPSLSDWGDLSDLDVASSYKNFGEKSNDEMQSKFKENINERCFDLGWMPIEPFKYYIHGLKQFILKEDFGLFAKESSVDFFFNLILRRLKNNPEELKDLVRELFPFIEEIAKRQDYYELDLEIYGSLIDKADEIKKILNN